MGSTAVHLRWSRCPPSESGEVADIRELDVSVHHGAAEAPRGLDCEADESDAELKYAVGLSYREPVPEPGACLIQWVDAHCPHDLAGDQRH